VQIGGEDLDAIDKINDTVKFNMLKNFLVNIVKKSFDNLEQIEKLNEMNIENILNNFSDEKKTDYYGFDKLNGTEGNIKLDDLIKKIKTNIETNVDKQKSHIITLKDEGNDLKNEHICTSLSILADTGYVLISDAIRYGIKEGTTSFGHKNQIFFKIYLLNNNTSIDYFVYTNIDNLKILTVPKKKIKQSGGNIYKMHNKRFILKQLN
jgi:hypothetical protein